MKKKKSINLKENDPMGTNVGGRFPGVDTTPVTKFPHKIDNQRKIDLIGHSIFPNMLDGSKVRILLGGETGIGKTSFVRDFCKMLGLPVIIIEVPHAVEEHLVNIPYIIDAGAQAVQGGAKIDSSTEAKQKYSIELAKSHIISQMERMKKVPDAQYPQYLKSLGPDVQQLMAEIEEQYPGKIRKIRSKYERVLFLDEFFRITSTSIRNTLRNILDSRIGNDRIPNGTYVMYASNTNKNDTGLDQSETQHTTFKRPIFTAPTVSAWLNRLIASTGGTIKKDVFDAFMQVMKDEHLDLPWVEGKTRISPRRWTDIFLQVNDAYPFENLDVLNKLNTLLTRQFKNDDVETHGRLSDAYEVLRQIIKKLSLKSGIDPSKVRELEPTAWRDLVAFHVFQKERIGENKKYVPVMAGPPGIGKTSSISSVFEQPPYNMRFIIVNCTSLSSDSITGIPFGQPYNDESGKQRTETDFSEPALSIFINQEMEKAATEYYNDLVDAEEAGELEGRTADEIYKMWTRQKYRFVVFFDEINRVPNTATFNSLRQLILEKKYNHIYSLNDSKVVQGAPDTPGSGVICLGAMNPTDEGTIGMTEHFKDSIDIIDSEPDWTVLVEHIHNKAEILKRKGRYDDTAIDTAYRLLERFPSTFTEKEVGGRNNYQFFPREAVYEFYVSPRDYDELFKSLCYSLDDGIENVIRRENRGDVVSQEEQTQYLTNRCFTHFHESLDYIIQKTGNVSDEWWDKLKLMISKTIDESIKKQTTISGISEILKEYLKSSDSVDLSDFQDGAILNSMISLDESDFQQQFGQFVSDVCEKSMSKDHYRADELDDFLFGTNEKSFLGVVRGLIDAREQSGSDLQIFDGIKSVSDVILRQVTQAVTSEFINDPLTLDNYVDKIASLYQELLKTL